MKEKPTYAPKVFILNLIQRQSKQRDKKIFNFNNILNSFCEFCEHVCLANTISFSFANIKLHLDDDDVCLQSFIQINAA